MAKDIFFKENCDRVFCEAAETLNTQEMNKTPACGARVFYISLRFASARRVLSQCNTRLRLLYLLNNVSSDTT